MFGGSVAIFAYIQCQSYPVHSFIFSLFFFTSTNILSIIVFCMWQKVIIFTATLSVRLKLSNHTKENKLSICNNYERPIFDYACFLHIGTGLKLWTPFTNNFCVRKVIQKDHKPEALYECPTLKFWGRVTSFQPKVFALPQWHIATFNKGVFEWHPTECGQFFWLNMNVC